MPCRITFANHGIGEGMETFSIGRVFSRTFQLMRDSLSTAGLFVLAISVLEFAMITGTALALGGSLSTGIEDQIWGEWLIGLLAYSLAWAGGIHGMLQIAFHGQTSLQECLRVGLGKVFPLTVFLVMWGLALMFGYVLFVIPMLMMLAAWAVAVPAMVGENLSIMDAFGRSRYLTRGYRLQIFAVLFALLLVMALVWGIGTASVINLSGGDAGEEGTAALLAGALMLPVGWLIGMLNKATLASLYVETFLVKEGSPTGQLSEVFG